MLKQPMIRAHDCLATAVAAVLNIEAIELPWTGREDFEQGWRLLRSALAERGWRLTFVEWTGKDHTLEAVIAYLKGDGFDTIDDKLVWIVSVTHPMFQGDAHVIVLRGAEIEFDPTFTDATRPPLGELEMRGSFGLEALDPGEFKRCVSA